MKKLLSMLSVATIAGGMASTAVACQGLPVHNAANDDVNRNDASPKTAIDFSRLSFGTINRNLQSAKYMTWDGLINGLIIDVLEKTEPDAGSYAWSDVDISAIEVDIFSADMNLEYTSLSFEDLTSKDVSNINVVFYAVKNASDKITGATVKVPLTLHDLFDVANIDDFIVADDYYNRLCYSNDKIGWDQFINDRKSDFLATIKCHADWIDISAPDLLDSLHVNVGTAKDQVDIISISQLQQLNLKKAWISFTIVKDNQWLKKSATASTEMQLKLFDLNSLGIELIKKDVNIFGVSSVYPSWKQELTSIFKKTISDIWQCSIDQLVGMSITADLPPQLDSKKLNLTVTMDNSAAGTHSFSPVEGTKTVVNNQPVECLINHHVSAGYEISHNTVSIKAKAFAREYSNPTSSAAFAEEIKQMINYADLGMTKGQELPIVDYLNMIDDNHQQDLQCSCEEAKQLDDANIQYANKTLAFYYVTGTRNGATEYDLKDGVARIAWSVQRVDWTFNADGKRTDFAIIQGVANLAFNEHFD